MSFESTSERLNPRRPVEERVDAFIEQHRDRIPAEVLGAGARSLLLHLARKADAGIVVQLALPGESSPRMRSEYELVTALLAELPIPANDPFEELPGDPQGDEYARATRTELDRAKGRGENIDYAEAARRTYVTKGSRPLALDPEGDAYNEAAEEEIVAARAKGEKIDFTEAARRVYERRGGRL